MRHVGPDYEFSFAAADVIGAVTRNARGLLVRPATRSAYALEARPKPDASPTLSDVLLLVAPPASENTLCSSWSQKEQYSVLFSYEALLGSSSPYCGWAVLRPVMAPLGFSLFGLTRKRNSAAAPAPWLVTRHLLRLFDAALFEFQLFRGISILMRCSEPQSFLFYTSRRYLPGIST